MASRRRRFRPIPPPVEVSEAALKAIKVSADLGPVKISANCEKFSVESDWSAVEDDAFNLDPAKVKGGLAWIGAFVSVDHQFKNHETTIFAGPKAKLGFGNVSGQVRDGVYIKVGADGKVTDSAPRPVRRQHQGRREWTRDVEELRGQDGLHREGQLRLRHLARLLQIPARGRLSAHDAPAASR